MIVYGSGLYGKTDEVPGLFYVATTFGHVWFLPLFPLVSCLVIDRRDYVRQVIPIRFSCKSMLLGWGRTGTMVTAVVAGLTALESRDPATGMMAACICAAALLAFFATKLLHGIRFATYERASALADLAGVDATGRIFIAVRYGRMSTGEAREMLARAEAEGLHETERYVAARTAETEARSLEKGRVG